MIGWRARFGVILPSVNTTTESEFYRCMPDGVTAHFSRMSFERTTPQDYEGMVEDVPTAARMLSHAKVDAVVFACTSGSLYGGLGYDATIVRTIEESSKTPASSTSTAAIEAFRAMNLRKVAVATPYEKWVDELEKNFFEANGIQVVQIAGLGLTGLDVCEMHPETFYRFAKKQDRRDADALFLSCMGLRTLEVLSRLEQELGKPVLSSNQVTLWKLFRMGGVPGSEIKLDFGRLFYQDGR